MTINKDGDENKGTYYYCCCCCCRCWLRREFPDWVWVEICSTSDRWPGVNFISMLMGSFYPLKCSGAQLCFYKQYYDQPYHYTQLEVTPNLYYLCQGWAKCGPRAKSGPARLGLLTGPRRIFFSLINWCFMQNTILTYWF